MSKRMVVYFVKGVPPFNPGERAAFPPDVAGHYIDQGWAVPVDEDGEPVLPEAQPPKIVDEGDPKGTPLPEGFPARDALIDSGLDTLEMVQAVRDFDGVPGIGQAYERRILDYLRKLES